MVLVDTNVLVDVFQADPVWAAWSAQALQAQQPLHGLVIDPVSYAELSMSFSRRELLDAAISRLQVHVQTTPPAALFLAGRAFLDYRRRGGQKASVLPDFFIGAHAAAMGWALVTRDAARFRAYFPTVHVIAPTQ